MTEISLSFEPHLIGGHCHVKVRAGQPGSRGLCGELIMRPDEWALLEALLEAGEGVRDVHPALIGLRRDWEDFDWWPPGDLVVINPDGWTPGETSRALEHYEALRQVALEVLRWDRDTDVMPADLYVTLAVAADRNPERAAEVEAEHKSRLS